MDDCNQALRHYQDEHAIVIKALEKADRRGLTRKAAALRTRLTRLEEMMDRVRKLKTTLAAGV